MTSGAMTSAAGLVSVLSLTGRSPLLVTWLRERAGDDGFALLDALGCLTPAGRALTWPCDDHAEGCPRVVMEMEALEVDDPTHTRLPVVAVCGREDAFCEPVQLSEEDVAQATLDVRPLVLAIAELLDVRGADRATLDPHAGGALAAIGVQATRDVWLLRSALHPGLADALATRAAHDRPSLVLAAARLDPALHAAHGPGAHVTLLALDEVLVLEGGALRLRGPVGAVAPAPAGDAALPRPDRWEALRVYRVDGHTVSLRVGRAAVRRTYMELGMMSAKSKQPTRSWGLLMAICEGGGAFRWKDHGSHDVVKQRIATLRKELRALFGVDEDPFLPFSMRDGWRPRFVARDGDDD